MSGDFTQSQRARIKAAARALLKARDDGRKCDPMALEWAENILRMNPGDSPPVPYDDDLPPEMAPWGVA